MNALVKKEIRLLAPGFIAGLLMVGAIWLLPEGIGLNAGVWLFLCAMLMMALGAFGREFSAGTFPMLLAQPVSRIRIWRTKTGLLAVMMALAWVAWSVSWMLNMLESGPASGLRGIEISTGLFAVAVYSGGLWTVLLFRQVTAAFWFTILAPCAIWAVIENSLSRQSREFIERTEILAFIAYGIAGFMFARWLFLRAQDAQWMGGNIRMPERCGLDCFKTGPGAQRKWRPRTALMMKEFQMHQAQFVMAGVLLLLHLGVIAIRKFGNVQKTSSFEILLESFWMLWLVIPLLIGCAAVAEERRMGTLEGQLCLPVKRRMQFGLKFFVVIVCSLVLGLEMPVLLEGTRILPDCSHSAAWYYMLSLPKDWWQNTPGISDAILNKLSWLALDLIVVGTASIAFYASSLARNTLQALAPAISGVALTSVALFFADMPEWLVRVQLWRGMMIYLVSLPVGVIVAAVLAYRNYQGVTPSWKMCRKNLIAIVVSLACVIAFTSAIYHRSWELLSPIEPAHSVPKLKPDGARIQVQSDGEHFSITALLPDGRAWLGSYILQRPNWFAGKKEEDQFYDRGKFLDGTDWLDVAFCEKEIAGIRRDGSLWISEKPGWKFQFQNSPLVRMDDGNDWKSIRTFGGTVAFLLKNDGTLWQWGVLQGGGTAIVHQLRSFTPKQMGKDADWVEIFSAYGIPAFRKSNGEVWIRRDWGYRLNEGEMYLIRDPLMESHRWKSTLVGFAQFRSFLAGVSEDGMFRELGVLRERGVEISHFSDPEWVSRDAQIGVGTDWLKALSLPGYWNKIFSLKADGTLWQWRYKNIHGDRTLYEIDTRRFLATRLSEHPDWVDISAGDELYNHLGGGFVSLAADGGLWLWRFEPDLYALGHAGALHSMLEQSRRPQFLGNIFDGVR